MYIPKIILLINIILITSSINIFPENSASHIDLKIPGVLDGNLITADDIQGMHHLGGMIHTIFYQTEVMIPGSNKKYKVCDLVKLEENNLVDDTILQKILEKIRKEILDACKVCLEKSHGSKDQFSPLIVEWCNEREKVVSPLKAWSTIGENEEREHFNSSITSFKKLEIFCQDLLLFLSDLIHSCPKAFTELKKRYSVLQSIQVYMQETLSEIEQKEFISFLVKNKNIYEIDSNLINKKLVEKFLHEYRAS